MLKYKMTTKFRLYILTEREYLEDKSVDWNYRLIKKKMTFIMGSFD
jgi:hypothetical protein